MKILVRRYCVVVALCISCGANALAEMVRAYIGTYTSGTSKGIYQARFDTATGHLSDPELAAETKNPSFLALHPNGKYLFAVGEISEFAGKPAGAVSAFEIQPNGKLTLLNQQASGGTGPCHLSVDKTGKCVLAANYGSGSIAALPVDDDGRLRSAGLVIQHEGSSANRQRQAGPHAHFIVPDMNNRFAITCDLGLDQVLVYRLESAKAMLLPNSPPSVSVKPGSGPRHLAFHPNGRFAYLINEMASTIIVLSYDAERGSFEEKQTLSTLAENFDGKNTCAEIQVHPSGKYVYGSNRGENTIAVFGVDPESGKLAALERQSTKGKSPRHFTLDPSGGWLLAENQDSDSIVIFRLNGHNGRLMPTGQTVNVGAPVCMVFERRANQ